MKNHMSVPSFLVFVSVANIVNPFGFRKGKSLFVGGGLPICGAWQRADTLIRPYGWASCNASFSSTVMTWRMMSSDIRLYDAIKKMLLSLAKITTSL